MKEYSLEIIENNIKNRLKQELTRASLLCRIHSRIKDLKSIEDKLNRKKYSFETKRMQDLIGFRITTFFQEDLNIVINLCRKNYTVLELVADSPNEETFSPLRKNMICEFPSDQLSIYLEFVKATTGYELIDSTFEIQFRTTLSEGWHEVDHMLRYKCKSDWEYLQIESRILNGIYASLETNDHALKALFEDITYKHYKKGNWEAMIRNKMRIRFGSSNLDKRIFEYLNNNKEVAKKILRIDRYKVLSDYIESSMTFPSTFDNWVFYINQHSLFDDYLYSITPEILKDSVFNIK